MIDLDAIEKRIDLCCHTGKQFDQIPLMSGLIARIRELQATCAQQNSQILILETAWKLFDAARQEQGFIGGGSTVWIDAAKEELGNGNI